MTYLLDPYVSKSNTLVHGYMTQEIIERVTKSTNRINANLLVSGHFKNLNGIHHLITICAHIYKIFRGSYHDTMERQSDVERIIK